MDILLTNDDGIQGPGLRAVHQAFGEAGHTLHVVAPSRQQSAVAHGMTVFQPLMASHVREGDFEGLAVTGKPADCVKLALGNLLPRRPDLVISGMNSGHNVGPDAYYSGTLAAACEAALAGLPSLALSAYSHTGTLEDMLPAARHAVRLATQIRWQELAPRTVVSVNYPAIPFDQVKGLRVCPLSNAVWSDCYEERRDPRGEPYWWLTGEIVHDPQEKTDDITLLEQGYVTVSSLLVNFNHPEGLKQLEGMRLA